MKVPCLMTVVVMDRQTSLYLKSGYNSHQKKETELINWPVLVERHWTVGVEKTEERTVKMGQRMQERNPRKETASQRAAPGDQRV